MCSIFRHISEKLAISNHFHRPQNGLKGDVTFACGKINIYLHSIIPLGIHPWHPKSAGQAPPSLHAGIIWGYRDCEEPGKLLKYVLSQLFGDLYGFMMVFFAVVFPIQRKTPFWRLSISSHLLESIPSAPLYIYIMLIMQIRFVYDIWFVYKFILRLASRLNFVNSPDRWLRALWDRPGWTGRWHGVVLLGWRWEVHTM